jgi:DNA-binding transcriptional ArsR family regulator
VPVDRGQLNAVGDLVLADAQALRAVADPERLDLFDAVRRHGPATSSELAGLTGRPAAAVDADLRELEAAGFVDRTGDDRWSTIAKGIYFEIPEEDGEAQRAARQLTAAMVGRYSGVPAAWARDDEPGLELDWVRAAGLFNARVALTPDELRVIQAELERVLEPYTTRAQEPADAAHVRVLAFFLPESQA